MSNFCIVSDNAADRSITVASTTAGAFVVGNLQSDAKSVVWRSTATNATLQASWFNPENIGAVILPFTNLTQAATIRVQAYSDNAGMVLVYDSGVVSACPAQPASLRGFTALQAQSAYAYGGGAYARLYFPSNIFVQNVLITLSDSTNATGYIEASRLIIGNCWSSTYNADLGATVTFQDTGKNSRTDAGDLITDTGSKNRKISIKISLMPPVDRTALASILRNSGFGNPIFMSIFPSNIDKELERDYQVYGKITTMSAMAITTYNAYTAPIDIEEV